MTPIPCSKYCHTVQVGRNPLCKDKVLKSLQFLNNEQSSYFPCGCIIIMFEEIANLNMQSVL